MQQPPLALPGIHRGVFETFRIENRAIRPNPGLSDCVAKALMSLENAGMRELTGPVCLDCGPEVPEGVRFELSSEFRIMKKRVLVPDPPPTSLPNQISLRNDEVSQRRRWAAQHMRLTLSENGAITDTPNVEADLGRSQRGAGGCVNEGSRFRA